MDKQALPGFQFRMRFHMLCNRVAVDWKRGPPGKFTSPSKRVLSKLIECVNSTALLASNRTSGLKGRSNALGIQRFFKFPVSRLYGSWRNLLHFLPIFDCWLRRER